MNFYVATIAYFSTIFDFTCMKNTKKSIAKLIYKFELI